MLGHVFHLSQAFLLKSASPTASTSSTIRISGSRCAATAKAKSYVHPAAEVLDGRIEELFDVGKGDDLVELLADLGAGHAEDRAVEINVLAAGQFRVEPGADFQEARHSAAKRYPAVGRLGDAAQDL